MASIDPKWTGWIIKSINKHFDQSQTTVQVFVVGAEFNALKQQTSYAEIRVNGPKYKEISNNYFKVELDISIMASALSGNNIYEIERLSGIYQSKMVPIIVKKYGDGDDFLGCLVLRDDVDPAIDTVIYGQSAEDTRIIQGSIEGAYRMELSL
jgi:hypothetical protein